MEYSSKVVKRMKLNEAIELYTKYVSITRSKGTLRYLKGKTGIINRYLGNIDCSEIDKFVILNFISEQKERNDEISNRTLNKYVGAITQVLKYSCDINLEFNNLPVNNKIIEIIPDHIINKIFNYYEKNQSNIILQRNYTMFRLFNETGIRLNELLNLKVNDIDLNNKSIKLRKTKTNNERYVFYSDKTNVILTKYIVTAKITDFIFIDFITGETLKDYSIESISQRLRKALSIDQSISPHKWRHTFATRYTNKNGNMEVLRQILGHSSLKTTQKYLHVNKDSLQQEYRRIFQ
jgi:integrase/recombinase XerD